MSLIKSISGIRGTIGNKEYENFTPPDIIRFVNGFIQFLQENNTKEKMSVVIGRDARISGEMVNAVVWSTLMASGVDIYDCGLASTPTVEMNVTRFSANGGIIITASHNPYNWNALKLLNNKGEFINEAEGLKVLTYAENKDYQYATADNLGKRIPVSDALDYHIEKILELPLVDVEAVKAKKYRIAIDGINSVGGIAIPALLKKMGVAEVYSLNCIPDGLFAHNPEPLPEHLTDICNLVALKAADVGFVVDPDVDRLAIVSEDASLFGEEYTLVAIADYVLSNNKGSCVSNLSSSYALRDLAISLDCQHYTSAVGEVHVVEKMKAVNAIIGGEGNGGVIYPELHYGRDALVGIALFLSHLAKKNIFASRLRNAYPDYFIMKDKMELNAGFSTEKVFAALQSHFIKSHFDYTDGMKILFDDAWVHLRKSNTEPIFRIYAESPEMEKSKKLINEIKDIISSL